MPEDQSAFLAERFVAAEGTALPGAARPTRPPLSVAPATTPPSPEALAAAIAELQRQTHALRFALLLARTFGVTTKLPQTPSPAMQAALLAAWIDAGCHGVPPTTPFAEQQLRHIPRELRP